MVVFLSVLVVVLAGAGVWWYRRRRPVPVVEAPAPPPEKPAKVEPTILIRYVSKKGKVLGEQRILKQHRRASRQYRYGNKTGTFLAVRQDADGAWVYGHSHDERT